MAHLIPNNSIPSVTQLKPKPVFIMKFRMSMDDYEFSKCKDTLFKSPLADDYHIITLRNNKDTDEFEMFNADKIERQDWNKLVNKIMK